MDSVLIKGLHIPYWSMWAMLIAFMAMSALTAQKERRGERPGRAWNVLCNLVSVPVLWIFIELGISSIVWYLNWPGH